jgi:YtkA-like
MNSFRLRPLGAAVISLALLFLGAGCSDSAGPTGGPVSGAADTHCAGQAQEVDLSTCHQTVPPEGDPDYGPTRYNSEADDDDCKYHVKFTVSPVRQNDNVTFTVTANYKFDGTPATGFPIDAEVFLNDTHPAPNSGQATTEKGGGVYEVGPIKFDAAGQWTVRFHFHHDCQDTTEDSPHGHVAFFISVP